MANRPPGLPDENDVAKVGYLNIMCGGSAKNALPHFQRNAERDGHPFAAVNVLIDTDPSSFNGVWCDVPIFLRVTSDIVDMVRGNASLFPSYVAEILMNETRMLAHGDISNGLRTTRCLSQLINSYYEHYISDQLREACDRLKDAGVTSILPVIASSTGGGTGSAFSVMMLDALSSPEFTSSMLLGYSPNILLPSLMFAVDPFAYARQKKGMQRKKILANAYAYRLELDALIKKGAKCQYIFHIGYANDHGTTIRTGDEMGQVLGNAIYGIERNYPELKRDWVDGPDDAAATDYARVTNSLTREMLNRKNSHKECE